jgi:hypothetical protein
MLQQTSSRQRAASDTAFHLADMIFSYSLSIWCCSMTTSPLFTVSASIAPQQHPAHRPAVRGLNRSVLPAIESSTASPSPSDGSLASGILGDVSVPRLIPTIPTIFNNLISGRMLQVALNVSIDGTRYAIPVTIRDTVAGRCRGDVPQTGPRQPPGRTRRKDGGEGRDDGGD